MKCVELALAFCLVFSLFACDGGSASPGGSLGGSCPGFTPCGGNIVGTWRLKSMCVKDTPTDAACTVQSSGMIAGAGYSVAYTFNANGTFTGTVSGSMIQTVDYPGAACSPTDASPSQYCSDIQQSMQSALAGLTDAGTFPVKSLSFTCTPSGSDVCKCNESLTYTPYTLEGTYTTSGDFITITMTGSSILPDAGIGDGGTGSPTAYCVSGNILTLGPTPGSSDEGEGVVVFTK
jgi:hypothetical protein